MKLLSWKRIDRGNLKGAASIELEIGLRIHDVLIFETNGKPWLTLPSKPLIGPDGQQIINEANNKPAFAPVLAWRDTRHADSFRRALIRLIREQHPDALPEGES
jgi:hypothetical protein